MLLGRSAVSLRLHIRVFWIVLIVAVLGWAWLPTTGADENDILWHRAWRQALKITDLPLNYAPPRIEFDPRLIRSHGCAGLYVLEGDLDRKGRPILRERILLALHPDRDDSGAAWCAMIHEALHATWTRRRILEPSWYEDHPDAHVWIRGVIPKACRRWE